MNRKQKVIDRLNQDILTITATIDMVQELIPDDLPEEATIAAIPGCLFIAIPYDWNIYRQVRRLLDQANRWIPEDTWIDGSDGHRSTVLYHAHSSARLHVQMAPGREGSTCTLEVIGTKTINVYQPVCKEREATP